MSNGARQRIMVVDDHESVLESFRLNLQSENYLWIISSGRAISILLWPIRLCDGLY